MAANQLVIYVTDTIALLDGYFETPMTNKIKETAHFKEILEALEEMDELESEVAALRTMRNENAKYIDALESDLARLRADLHNCWDLLEGRSA